jgi:hypothetical protein
LRKYFDVYSYEIAVIGTRMKESASTHLRP